MPLVKKKEATQGAQTPRKTVKNPKAGGESEVPAAEGGKKYVFAIGRRKEAVALVRLYPVRGAITVNGKPLSSYIQQPKLQDLVQLPFSELKIDPLRVEARVRGGGTRGQAEALRLGISRALVTLQPESKARLRAAGLLTRDARVKERRKYGLKKARRAPQWAKR